MLVSTRPRLAVSKGPGEAMGLGAMDDGRLELREDFRRFHPGVFGEDLLRQVTGATD